MNLMALNVTELLLNLKIVTPVSELSKLRGDYRQRSRLR
jgi:hypothetical protein